MLPEKSGGRGRSDRSWRGFLSGFFFPERDESLKLRHAKTIRTRQRDVCEGKEPVLTFLLCPRALEESGAAAMTSQSSGVRKVAPCLYSIRLQTFSC